MAVQATCLYCINILDTIWTRTHNHFKIFKSHSTFKPVSTPHKPTEFVCWNLPCSNNNISYTAHITLHNKINKVLHITLHNTLPYKEAVRTYLIYMQDISIHLCRHMYYISIEWIQIMVQDFQSFKTTWPTLVRQFVHGKKIYYKNFPKYILPFYTIWELSMAEIWRIKRFLYSFM